MCMVKRCPRKTAKTVAKLEVDGVSDMAFIVGGAFGVSDELRRSVNYKLSFSPMTFTHQMVRFATSRAKFIEPLRLIVTNHIIGE